MPTINPVISDPVFGMHAQALSLQRQRMEVIAANLANVDTPHYQARELDFASALAQAAGANTGTSVALATTQPGHLGGGSAGGAASPIGSGGAELKYRIPLQPSTDGNTVDAQVEQAAFADAALHYQASLSFADGRIKSLMTAITGQ
jgi:flagellar basal-body rod protein FlgB